ncbi:hypothetical protein OK016_02460 [Vibrio chagasii]|nr:hypothetical protein [Vibrio chagasii]
MKLEGFLKLLDFIIRLHIYIVILYLRKGQPLAHLQWLNSSSNKTISVRVAASPTATENTVSQRAKVQLFER